MERSLGDSEGPCHLNHRAFADREVPDDSIGRDAVVGEDLVEFAANERPGAAPPTPSGDGRVKDTRILSNREIGTQRQLLEHATNAELLGEDHGIVFLWLSAHDDLA